MVYNIYLINTQMVFINKKTVNSVYPPVKNSFYK